MKILVTGGTGFTGKALVKRLLQNGHSVNVLDKKEGLKTEELREWGASVTIGSVTDREVVARTMKNVTLVQHVAAAFREMDVPESYYHDVNVEGTKIVLEEALKAGAGKLIYCSTCGVHGNIIQPPADEQTDISPADYYQKTKYLAEPIVLDYNSKGLKTVILRPAAIYGPGDPERFGMIFRQVNRGFFPFFGDGSTLYHPLYIDNFVDALVNVMAEGVGDGQVYLIADKKYLPIKTLVSEVARVMDKQVKMIHLPFRPVRILSQVVEAVCKPIGIAPPIFPRRVDWYKQNRAFDISKAQREIGFNPAIDISEGLRRTALWYKKENYL